MKLFLSFLIALSANATVLTPPAVDPSCEQLPSDVAQFSADIENILQRQRCEPYRIGEARVSVQGSGDRFGLSGNYSLKRLSENQYAARINVSFNDGGGPGSGSRMLARSRECISRANEHLRGPGGEQLVIQLLTPEETSALPESERPRNVNIHIDDPGAGGHSYNFPSTFNCPDIVHEFLHHLGLCDEYSPSGTWNGGQGALTSACRVVVRSPAYLMNNKDAAWSGFFVPRDPRDPPRREQSLIAPNHFYKILEMDCRGRSAAYQVCGSYAYRGENCEQVPAFCRDPNIYLGRLPERQQPQTPVVRRRSRHSRR